MEREKILEYWKTSIPSVHIPGFHCSCQVEKMGKKCERKEEKVVGVSEYFDCKWEQQQQKKSSPTQGNM